MRGMEGAALKHKIEQFMDRKEGFDNLRFIEQIKYLAYFYIKSTGKTTFSPSDIGRVLRLVSLQSPKNVSDMCLKLYHKGIFVRDTGFGINHKIFKDLEKEFSQQTAAGGTEVLYISGSTPWTDRNKLLPEFLKKLRGEILAVDSYYGLGTFHVLGNFPKGQTVKFLTAQVGRTENEDTVHKELRRFRGEFPNIELRKFPHVHELHDRYLLSDNLLVWVGHGLKDFGDKESFLIGIPIDRSNRIATTLKTKFAERWVKSQQFS